MPETTESSSESGPAGKVIGLAERRAVSRPIFSPFQAWARSTFSRDQLTSGLKSLLWVAPLTILIWIYAEREQLATVSSVTVPIDVASNDARQWVTLRNPPDRNLMVTLTGPRAQVDYVRKELEPRSGGGPIRVEIDHNLGPGLKQVSATRVGNDKLFASHGVTVSNYQPATLDVFIDPIVERELAVRPPPGLPTLIPPVFEPARVMVSGPQSVLDEAKAQNKLFVTAELAGRPELNAGSGSITLKDVRLTISPPDRNISFAGAGPAMVTAQVDLTQGKQYQPQFVGVVAVTSPELLDEYKIVDYEKTLTNVTFVGPEDKIEMLKNKDYQPKPEARFRVTLENYSDQSRPVTVPLEYAYLPDGVRVTPDSPSTITFRLVKRRDT
jgi:hypothetical protein